MKKVIFHSKSYLYSKTIFALGQESPSLTHFWNKTLAQKDVRILGDSPNSRTPWINDLTIKNSKILTNNKISKRFEMAQSVNNVDNEPWGRSVIVFNHFKRHKKHKNVKCEEKNLSEKTEPIKEFSSCKDVKMYGSSRGKFSIIFVHSNRRKRVKETRILGEPSIALTTGGHANLNMTECFKENMVGSKCINNIVEGPQIIGKLNIVFNRSGRYKNRCGFRNVLLSSKVKTEPKLKELTQETVKLEENDNSSEVLKTSEAIQMEDPKNFDTSGFSETIIMKYDRPRNGKKFIEKVSSLPKKIFQSLVPPSEDPQQQEIVLSTGTDSGKFSVTFDRSQKAKRIRQLRKHFAPKGPMKDFKKVKEEDKQKEDQLIDKTEDLEWIENTLNFNEVGSPKINEQCVIMGSENVKIVVIPPRVTDDKVLNLNILNQPEMKEIRTDINCKDDLKPAESVNEKTPEIKIIDLNMAALNQPEMKEISITNCKNNLKPTERPKEYQGFKTCKKNLKRNQKWKTSATRFVMDKSKDKSLDKLIMMNSDPQCGFITGVSRMSKPLPPKDDQQPKQPQEVAVQTVVFQEFHEVYPKSDTRHEEARKPSEMENCEDARKQSELVNCKEASKPMLVNCKVVFEKEYTLMPKLTEKTDEERKMDLEKNIEFNGFLSDPSEIGALTINSTRSLEAIELMDTCKKARLDIGEVKPLEQVLEISRKIKSESKIADEVKPLEQVLELGRKESESKIAQDIESICNSVEIPTMGALNENSHEVYNTHPLELKAFLNVVSNLLEMSQANGEIIDDLVGLSTIKNNCKYKTKSYIDNYKSNSMIETNKDLQQFECSAGGSIRHRVCSTGDKETKHVIPEIHEIHNFVNENPKESIIHEIIELPTKTEVKQGKVANHFERPRVEDVKPSEPISKNVSKEKMKAYKEFSEKFEKMGLYKKQTKKISIHEIKEDKRKITPRNPLKKDIELQEKFKNTPEGKRLQEYFDSFRFKLTASMKGEKKKKSQSKKVYISSKLGKLIPETSPSKPSFSRRGNGEKK